MDLLSYYVQNQNQQQQRVAYSRLMGASKDLATVTMTLVPNTWKRKNKRYLQEKQKKITVHSWCINNMSQGQQMAKQLSFACTHIHTQLSQSNNKNHIKKETATPWEGLPKT